MAAVGERYRMNFSDAGFGVGTVFRLDELAGSNRSASFGFDDSQYNMLVAEPGGATYFATDEELNDSSKWIRLSGGGGVGAGVLVVLGLIAWQAGWLK